MQVGSQCETYYGENYCVTVMCGCHTVWFRYVIKPCEGWVPDDTWYLIRMFGNNDVRACNKVSLYRSIRMFTRLPIVCSRKSLLMLIK